MVFNKIRTTIIPPMTSVGPVDGRKYTIYSSNITGECFVVISDSFCYETSNQLIRNNIFAKWYVADCGYYKLKIYVNLGDENNLMVFTRYIMYKQILTEYIHATLYADREFFRRNKCMLNSQITVRFISGCEKFNVVENYGTLNSYR